MEKKQKTRRKKAAPLPGETSFFRRGICCVVLAALLLVGSISKQAWVEPFQKKLSQQVTFSQVKEAALEAKETVETFLEEKTTVFSPKTTGNEN